MDRGNGAAVQKRLWHHLFITDYGWPWRIAAETGEVIITGLRIQVGDAALRLFPVQFLVGDTARAASVIGRLLGRAGGAIDIFGSRLAIFIGLGRLGGFFGLIRLRL